MRTWMRSGLCLLVVLATSLWLWPAVADAQVFVYPRRPSQTNVRWFDFEWHHIDILVGPEASGETLEDSGPRLHYGPEATGGSAGFESYGAGGAWDWAAGRLTQQAGGGQLSAQGGDQSEGGNPGGEAGDDELAPWSGGVRLFFYEREREVAERAAGLIEQEYRELVDAFDYVPDKTFPYFLYSSYHEFLQTNLFPIQEGVLGVTSPQTLEVTLPYFGDHALFHDVSKHELAHEFTIQKVRTFAEKNKAGKNPLMKMPLWFIEGLAEYYAKDGLDPETETLVRDLVVNPDIEEEYVLEGFFDDRRRSFLWTYKLGQARAAFLEETYGEGTIQKVLEESYRLVGTQDGNERVDGFPALLTALTGDSRETITKRFQNWIKQRHFRTYLDADQSPGILEDYDTGNGLLQAMSSSPSGEVLMYRSIVRETGQRKIYMADYRDAEDAEQVASDGKPGLESLHPIAGRNFDLGDDSLAFVAQREERDVIYFQRYDREVQYRSESARDDRDNEAAASEEGASETEAERTVRDVDFEFHDRQRYDLEEWDIVAVDTLSVGPDGRRIAFVGLAENGQKDLFLLEPRDDGERFAINQLTDDIYAEREVSWGAEGIVFTSDATENGHYNIFGLDPDTKEIERITFEERDHTSPRMLSDGRVFFVAYDEVGANVYQAVGPGLVRKTGLATALSDLSAGPDEGLWALQYYQGEQRPARIPSARLLDGEISTQALQAAAYTLPSRSLDEAERYDVWETESWDIGTVFGIVGASSQGVAGQGYATAYDKLRDHTLILNLLATGSWESIDGSLFYINQEDRVVWGGGLFQDVGYRLDRTFEDDPDTNRFISSERFFGATGTVRYPFDRFSFIQGSLAAGGLDFFVFDGTEECLRDPSCIGREGAFEQWEQTNEDVRFQLEPSASVGHNTIRYHPQTGPFMGHSMLLSGTYDWQPFRQRGYATTRLDAEKYWSLWGRTNFFLRGGAGYTFGDRFARSFFLSSFDTVRGVPWGDFDYLLGRSFAFTTAELQFPLNFLVRVPFIDLEGIVGTDFGAAGDDFIEVWDRRVLNAVAGVNFGLGPFVFRLHFAKPYDIGAIRTPRGGDWNTNFSLTWRYW
ncbi:MAG: tolB protein precursor protein [Persicimonas sp.]